MEVRPGCPAAGTNIADGLPLCNRSAGLDAAGESVQVEVLSGVLLTVLNHDVSAGGIVLAPDGYLAVAGSDHGGATLCCVVDASMGHNALVDGVHTLQVEG